MSDSRRNFSLKTAAAIIASAFVITVFPHPASADSPWDNPVPATNPVPAASSDIPVH